MLNRFSPKTRERLRLSLRIVLVVIFYVDTASDMMTLQLYYEFPALGSLVIAFFAMIGERVVAGLLMYHSRRMCNRHSESRTDSVLKSVLFVALYLDPIVFVYLDMKHPFKVRRRLEKYRKLQMLTYSMLQSSVTVGTSVNLILRSHFMGRHTNLSTLRFSMIMSLISIASRVTEYYIRRARSCRNHKYAKSLRTYESLSDTEKEWVFYPRFVIILLADIM